MIKETQVKYTDLFINRPVLATVLSLFILVLGLRSISELPIRQYPFTQNAVVTVATAYVGADPEIMAGFITTPLENAIAQANGIDYLSSSSTPGLSVISANLRLNYEPNKALSEINTKVNSVLNQLPKEAQQPIINIQVGESIDSMYIGFYSETLPSNKISDYLIRVVQPKLQAVEGVQLAEILGNKQFAMRIWLDPFKMAAYNITGVDVSSALAKNDFISAVGRTEGELITVNLTTDTGLHTVEEFKKLIVKSVNNSFVRLEDVANISLGSEDYDSDVSFDGNVAVYVGIKVAPAANLLTVVENIRKVFPAIEAQIPQGLNAKIVYDATKYIQSSIHEVEHSLLEALLIVTVVIFLFLGSVRSVIIPVVAIPLSLVGAVFMMLLMGFSINLLTLLALVLAIGLVVDDAIIVVENVHRHMEDGRSRLEASLIAARELANPIIAISVVLIAVYIPIGFMGGLTGALFTEFAFTLAGAVAISAVVALTLSPMMCSKLLTIASTDPASKNNTVSFINLVDNFFEKVKSSYEAKLTRSLDNVAVTVVFAVIILSSIYFLYSKAKTELAPQEDQGIIISLLTTAPNATLSQTEIYAKKVYEVFSSKKFPEKDHVFQLNGVSGLNSSIGGVVLKPWDERTRTSNQMQPLIQQELAKITGANIVAFQPASLPGSSGLPVQFVLATTEPYSKLNEVTQTLLEKARSSGFFMFVDSDLKFDKKQVSIELNREKAAEFGLSLQDIGNALASTLSGNYVNYFSLAGRSYKVIPQLMDQERLDPAQLLNNYITTKEGYSIPLSTLARLKSSTVPQALNHFQQLNSATISGVPMIGISLGEALEHLKVLAKEVLPESYSTDSAGQSRQYLNESSGLMLTFFFALLVIFLTLAALFESFRDPLIILISVPMSIWGAMLFISLGIGGASLNIYTEVGLVTLIGLIAKHGILIVQFANDLQREGHAKREAIQMSASIRLRPILMTTAAMVLGVLPLILATGAGAVSRFNIGLVIAAGISIGTLFTLFVVPSMYLLLGHSFKKHVEEVEKSSLPDVILLPNV